MTVPQRHNLIVLCFMMLLLGMALPVSAHSGNEPEPLETVLPQVMALVGAGMVAGGALFSRLFGTAQTQIALRRLMLAGWIACGAAVLLALWGRSTITGLSLAGTLAEPLLSTLLGVQFGVLWLVTLGVWAVIGVLWTFAARVPVLTLLLIAVPLLLPALIEILGHTPTPEHALARSAAGWLYAGVQALLLGMLIAFALTRQHYTGRAYLRRIGAAMRWLLLALVGGWTLVGALQPAYAGQLLTTEYGRGVSLVAVGFVVALGLAIVNRPVDRPRWIGAEVGVGVILLGVLLLSSGNLPPVNPYSGGFVSLVQQTAQSEVVLSVEPGYVGANRFTVLFNDLETGRPTADISGAALVFTLGDQRSGFPLNAEADGVYSKVDSVLIQDGTWQIEVLGQRSSGEAISSSFLLQIDASPVPDEAALTAGFAALLPSLVALLGVMGIVIVASGLLTRSRG